MGRVKEDGFGQGRGGDRRLRRMILGWRDWEMRRNKARRRVYN